MNLNRENTILNIIKQSTCTGCGGCKNACPTDSIEMKEDAEGFLFPFIDSKTCIHCGKCTQVCPVVNPRENSNHAKPDFFAVRCSDEIRRKSSSGGMFALLANYIFANGGYVVGAEFDENMQLHHSITNDKNQLSKMQGSKYLQSNTGLIYRKIKSVLENGYSVLFTGCPCQVAALRRFLGKEYESLYAVDILCHGVPSQKIFNKYLKEKTRGKQVSDVRFRDKRYGWNCTKIIIDFENEKAYEGNWNNDPFERGFHKNLFLRTACADCTFSEIPRMGDLSIGDFWGIDTIDQMQNDGKGTSMVMVNSAKGEKLFQAVSSQCTAKKMNVSPSQLPNRLNRIYLSNKKRTQFFDLVRSHSVSTAVAQSLDNKYDIGLVGNYRAKNFGGALTYYCLYQTIKDMGYSVLMIERPLNAKVLPGELDYLYENSPYADYEISPLYASKEEMECLNKKCNTFVVGSDQLFQYTLFVELGSYVTLDWIHDNKRKIAYAASFGRNRVWGDRDILDEMAFFMQKFDYFSVREASGVMLAQKEFGVKADVVLDPVFMVNREHLEKIAQAVHRERDYEYVGAYVLDPSKQKNDLIKYIADAKNMQNEVFSEMTLKTEYFLPLESVNVVNMKVDERIDCIANCSFFITDSFHGTCLSIIFRKPFISIMNEKRGADRFRSMLSHLGLDNRLIVDINYGEIGELLTQDINYDEVYQILNQDRITSYNWLKKALTDRKKKYYSDYDIMCKKMAMQAEEIEKLQKQINMLIRVSGTIIPTITNIYEYLDELKRNQTKYIILISVKDTPGFALNEEISSKIIKLGLKSNLINKHWHSYIGILNGRRVIYDRLSNNEETVAYDGCIRNLNVSVKSKSYREGNLSSIIINGIDYAINKRGLNIVVVDSKKGIVLDQVCFDTHNSGLTCYRA